MRGDSDGTWNVIPLECVRSEPPRHSEAGSEAARRWLLARFGSPIPPQRFEQLMPNPLKEQS